MVWDGVGWCGMVWDGVGWCGWCGMVWVGGGVAGDGGGVLRSGVCRTDLVAGQVHERSREPGLQLQPVRRAGAPGRLDAQRTLLRLRKKLQRRLVRNERRFGASGVSVHCPHAAS
eukprot:3080182-Rhodomonas_salina.1